MGLFSDGWNAFVTEERDFNDGEEACSAELEAIKKGTKKKVTYNGDTKACRGHAEIDALYQFLKTINWDIGEYTNYSVTITCLSKPCCKYCAAVMGLCGISPTKGTYKVKKTMGVSYALPPDVRTFLRKFLNTTEDKILSELCG